MTSITSNVTSIPQASPSTNSSAPSNSTHARTPSVSGQTSSSAAVQGSAPAQRVVSYAHAASTAATKKPSTPVIAASPSPHIPVGIPAQNARSSSTASQAVNGKMPPAVANSGPSPANGNNTPFLGGHHSRKSSLASGAGGIMPNGAPRAAPPIMFGAINEAGTGPALSGSAAAASNASLTAPVATNQRVSSPQSSPSPIVQPMASGGAPPQTSGTGNRGLQFGDAVHHHQQTSRPMSMPPPAGPGGMNMHTSHQRRESTQSAHTDTGPSHMHHNRGGMQNTGRGGGNRSYGNHHQFNQNQYNPNYGGRGGYVGNPQSRGQPPNIHNQQQYQGPGPIQGYPNSPRMINRSPAMAHVSPALAPVQPVGTQQLYPPPHYMTPPHPQQYGGLQASIHYDPQQHIQHQQMYYYNQPHLAANYGYPIPQTSPRVGYAQPANSGYGYMPQSMSRSGSTNMAHMEVPRPNSSMGQQLPTPTLTPQPISVPPANSVPPALATTGSSFARVKSKAIQIVNPTDGSVIKPAPSPVVVTSAPVIVSSPSPAPGRTVTRDPQHAKTASKSANSKSDQEIREEAKASIQKMIEENKLKDEEEKKRKEAEALEQERIEAEKKKKETEERLRREKEEEERKLKEEAEEAERVRKEEEKEKARKEAEEEAKRKQEEEEARIKKEAEEAEAAARVAREKAEEEARIAKEKEEELRLQAEKAQKLKEEEEAKAAKAKADAEAEERASAEAAQKAASLAPKAAPDSETMPPPAAKSAEKRGKPTPLNLQIKTNEPAPPSAALTALKSARFIENINSVNYPANILSPNPALNPAASGKFKYEKDFLLQFQGVFTEKPSVDWDKTMRDTVGEPESARPQTARTPSGLGPRSTSRSGASVPPPMGAFGSFKPSGIPANMLTSAQRFEQSRSNSLPVVNPLAAMAGSFSGSRSGGVNIMRTNSSSSLASSGVPQSPRSGNRSSRGSRKGGGAPMEKTESRQGDKNNQPTISITDVKPLPVSENRWKPISIGAPKELQAAPTPSEEVKLSPELVQRKVKAALNKMTPEKFDKIAGQILEITSQSKFETDGRTLRQVIQLTFEKATDEAAWSSMYAKFCKRMLESMDPNIKDENIRDKNGLIVTGGNLFRKYLLNRCQEEFERGWKVNLPPKPEGVSDEAVMLSDEYYIAAAAKRRGLGLVQFIGELFKLGMLTERIMNECVRKLLDFEGLPEDETVESLCKLLKTIGFQLDASEKIGGMMDKYFARISRLAEDKELNSRMRFMLMDIIDLRRKKWETKEADKGPKTIQEVREDALKAQQEKEAVSRANNQRRPNNGGGPGRGGDGRSYSGFGNPIHPPGWDQSKGGTLNAEDLRRLSAKSRQASSGSQSFGPNNMLGPRSSSSGGSRRGGFGLGPNRGPDDSNASSRTATPPAKASTSHANPFSALQEGTSAHHESSEQNDTTSPPASSPPTAALGFGRARSPLPIGESK